MGILRPHVSRHVFGRAPRRGRRPRRPVFRSPIAGCTRVLHVCLRRPYFFQQRKKYGKERRQKPTVFGFPFRPIVTAVQKGSTPDRLHSYPRCRSCVPRLNAPMGTPRPHVSRHVSGRAPRRGRRPRRPVFRSPIAGCTRVLHVCLRRPYFFQQRKKYGKERRQKPSVFGFPFRPIVTAVQKGSAPDRLHSYPCCRSCVPRENFLLSRRTEKVLYILHTFIFCGPKGRTYLSQPAGKRYPLPCPAFERPNGHTPPTRISSCLRSRTP